MALRLIELTLPKNSQVSVKEALEDYPIVDIWQDRLLEGKKVVRVLLPIENTEKVLDLLEKRFSHLTGFRLVLLPVEASIPRPQTPEKKEPAPAKDREQEKAATFRVSREELYADINEEIKLSWVFVLLVGLSAVVAGIGLLKNSVAIIIGAMVIAPLLGPNVALALSTTLGDLKLALKAVKANLVGLLTALAVAFLMGLLLRVDPTIPELAGRTTVGLGDVSLALAAGVAGVLSFTRGMATSIVGVMVAVALLPPLVVFGMLLGAGFWTASLGALLLLITTLIAINLAGVLTFLLQGVRPMRWWEEKKAKTATRLAILFWLLALGALILVILLAK